jgi:hypothetical protein
VRALPLPEQRQQLPERYSHPAGGAAAGVPSSTAAAAAGRAARRVPPKAVRLVPGPARTPCQHAPFTVPLNCRLNMRIKALTQGQCLHAAGALPKCSARSNMRRPTTSIVNRTAAPQSYQTAGAVHVRLGGGSRGKKKVDG